MHGYFHAQWESHSLVPRLSAKLTQPAKKAMLSTKRWCSGNLSLVVETCCTLCVYVHHYTLYSACMNPDKLMRFYMEVLMLVHGFCLLKLWYIYMCACLQHWVYMHGDLKNLRTIPTQSAIHTYFVHNSWLSGILVNRNGCSMDPCVSAKVLQTDIRVPTENKMTRCLNCSYWSHDICSQKGNWTNITQFDIMFGCNDDAFTCSLTIMAYNTPHSFRCRSPIAGRL